jgi:hypothetical protein
MSEPNRYFVIEHATGIVRAAQPTLRGAQAFTTPANCHERYIVGPITPENLRRLFNTYKLELNHVEEET